MLLPVLVAAFLNQLLLYPLARSQETIQTGCAEDEWHFKCLSGKCIPMYWLCDGTYDCPDHEDEHQERCDPKPRGAPPGMFVREECPPRQFKCKDIFGNPKCALEEWLCDNQNDCADGVDEMYCDDATDIPQILDGNKDESTSSPRIVPTNEVTTPTTECVGDQFRCVDGRCIDRARLCDGHRDCRDAGDESQCDTTADSATTSTLFSTSAAMTSPNLLTSTKSVTTLKSAKPLAVAAPLAKLLMPSDIGTPQPPPSAAHRQPSKSATVSATANKPIRISIFSHPPEASTLPSKRDRSRLL